MRNLLVTVAGAVMLMAGPGCASRQAATTPAVPASGGGAANDKAPGDARVGDRTHCPVSGDAFTVTAGSPHAEYNGKTYYFCCAGCSKEFQENPAKFLHET